MLRYLREYLEAIRGRYCKAGRKEKAVILASRPLGKVGMIWEQGVWLDQGIS